MSVDAFVHVANVLFLLSYLVRDILWLRVLTVVAIVTLGPYYYFNGLVAPVIWNTVFVAINFIQIRRLLLERRPVTLDERHTRLYQQAFRALKPREFLKLAGAGRWVTCSEGECLIKAGQELDVLRIVERGEVAVKKGDQVVASLRDGRMIGEMSYLTGGPCSAAVWTTQETSFLCWERGSLDAFLERNPSIRGALQLVIGTDLASKLRGG